MIPKYAFTVTVEYQARIKRPSVSKSHETLASAMMVYNHEVNRQDVRRVTVTMIIEQSERWEQPHK